MEKRQLERITTELLPISCILRVDSRQFCCKLINYTFNGACIEIPKAAFSDSQNLEDASIEFRLGQQRLSKLQSFAVKWKDECEQNYLVGLELFEANTGLVERCDRIKASNVYSPTVSCADPTDPTRKLFFKVLDISDTGILLETSLSNRHLLPGMPLANAKLELPAVGSTTVSLFIENSRKGEGDLTFKLGVSVNAEDKHYRSIVADYLSLFGEMDPNTDRVGWLRYNTKLAKKFKSGLTFKVLKSNEEYEEVLKLRMLAYSAHGKVLNGQTWHQMGEGRGNEGVIICGYLKGQLVATVEARISGLHSLRSSNLLPREILNSLRLNHVIEINKLSIHPSAQNTDVLLGVIQRLHALCYKHGNPDVLLLATSLLKPLYLKLGAKETGTSIPHPSLEGESLSVLLFKPEVYSQGKGINGLTWNAVFADLNTYLAQINRTQVVRVSKVKSYLGYFASAAWEFISKKIFKNKSTHSAVVSTSYQFIDPKWTSQHYVATVMLPYILEAEALVGRRNVQAILRDLGVNKEYLSKKKNWISVDFFDEFLNRVSKFVDTKNIHKAAGIRAMSAEVMGVDYYLLKVFGTAQIAFKSFETLMNRHNRTRYFKLESMTPNSARIVSTLKEGFQLPQDKASCQNITASFSEAIKVVTGKPCIVTEPMCLHKGDAQCRYEIKWKEKRDSVWSSIVGAVLVTYLVFYFTSKVESLNFRYALSVFGGLVFLLIFSLAKLAKKISQLKALTAETEHIHKEADEKYQDLQKSKLKADERYKEASIIEDMSKQIIRSSDISEIMNKTLEAVCSSFNFSRAFIMLADSEFKNLTTAAIGGQVDNTSAIWQFQVNVEKFRDKSIFISSVYLTGKPVLMTNVEDSFFQFTEQSQQILKQLSVKSFCVVPIPSDEKNWGVLLADKGSNQRVNRQDLVLLQRVAQHLGLALDKQHAISKEVTVRNIFKKYVPQSVVDDVMQLKLPSLGGQRKQIYAMFLDIRRFTELATRFNPDVLVAFLNRVYREFEHVVRKSGGTVDKYLGDGMMITFGTDSQAAPDCNGVVTCALELVETSYELADQLRLEGIEDFRVGIGLCRGEVVVGNLGCDARMEYTVIGTPVNLASRLESLNKTYDSDIAMPSELLSELTPFMQQRFFKINNVTVRGLDKAVDLACLKAKKSEQDNKFGGMNEQQDKLGS